MRTALALALGLFCAAGCRTTITERPRLAGPAEIRRAEPSRTWTVVAQGTVAGRVVLFETAGRPEGAIYMVQNAWDQDLGMVDSLGRAWRYEPHEREASWVGTGTVADGVARILRTRDACLLHETPLDSASGASDAAASR